MDDPGTRTQTSIASANFTLEGFIIEYFIIEIQVLCPLSGAGLNPADGAEIRRYDGSRISVDIRLEDPDCLAEPSTAQLIWYYAPHLEPLHLGCDPDSASAFTQ